MKQDEFLALARESGVDILEEDGAVIWQGENTGTRKPYGPLSGLRVGALVASEFSDFQAYYLAEYIAELGGSCTFLGAEKQTWKHTRPNLATKGIQGMWGVSLDPIPVLGRSRSDYRSLADARPEDFDVLIVLGGHSADIVQTEDKAVSLIQQVHAGGGTVCAIGEGSLALVPAGLLDDARATGNRIVSYLIERLGHYEDRPVVVDGSILTARDTVDTPALVHELAAHLDPTYEDRRRDILPGKRIVIVAGEDFEDIELVTPFLEFLHRGASITFGTFPAPMRSRPPMISERAVMGNFGVSVPLQEVSEEHYDVRPLAGIAPEEVDLIMIPGAFCPWNMVAAGAPVDWLRHMHASGKLIAAICHGAIPLSAADLVRDRHCAGVHSCRDHVLTMGGMYDWTWSAVVDGPLVTGRVPFDVPEFMDAMTYALVR